jgi:DNA polymerase III epsilon subunit family exonuclease
MEALRRARLRLADTPGPGEPGQGEPGHGEPGQGAADGGGSGSGSAQGATGVIGAEQAGALSEAGPRERDPGDGHYWRLLPGLLPAGPFLPPGDLVIVDVETTGWFADEAGITEIGAVRLSPGRPMTEFSALVNPGTPIPGHITELTGITDGMVADAPAITDVLPDFLRFAAGGVIVAHNAPFDVAFLAAACAQCGTSWPHSAVIDTAVLSRMLLGPQDVPDHRLATLSCHFDAQTGPCHRALADAKATAAVLKGLLGVLARGPRPTDGPSTYRHRDSPPAAAAVSDAPSRYDVAATGANVPTIEEAAMVTAIVLIKADVARIPETAEAIAQIEQVSEVYSVTGEFDLVAMVRVRGHDELGDVIPGRVNKVHGVTHTETHIAFRTYSRHDLDAAFSIGYPETA